MFSRLKFVGNSEAAHFRFSAPVDVDLFPAMDTLKCRAVQWLTLGVLALVVLALLPTPHGWVPQSDTVKVRPHTSIR